MRKFISFLLVFTVGLTVYCQNVSDAFEFVNQDLRDIVYILSGRLDTPVICDETVSGKGNFLYKANGRVIMENVFQAFLDSNRLYVTKTPSLWTVTRTVVCRSNDNTEEIDEIDEIDQTENGFLFNTDAYDLPPREILCKLAAVSGVSILFDTLPSEKVSIHLKNQTVLESVKAIVGPYPEYQVIQKGNSIYIERNRYSPSALGTRSACCEIRKEDGLYCADIQDADINQAIETLFTLEGVNYSSFLGAQTRIDALNFTKKSFDSALELILQQVNGDYTWDKGTCYLLPGKQSGEKTARQKTLKWEIFHLEYLNAREAIPLLQSKFPESETLQTGNYTLAILGTDIQKSLILDFLGTVDYKESSTLIKLKYIKSTDLLAHLPPGIAKEDLTESGSEDCLFFNGSPEKLEHLKTILNEIDRPKKVIRYDLLILQYTKNSSLSWGINQSVKTMNVGDKTCISGELGSVLNINFDLITHFGLLFSEKINAAIAENRANVFADTTLHALEGEKVSFKNTSTYRYKDITSTAESAYTSVTREINSGLVLDIESWVSGDGMITMDVKASVSKQGIDLSKNSGNPPPTSEKFITTKVRTKSGEPVILSGLSQRDMSEGNQRVPLLGRLPLIGGLFKNRSKTEEKTEMTVYLVPHIEEDEEPQNKTDWQKKGFQLVFDEAIYEESI